VVTRGDADCEGRRGIFFLLLAAKGKKKKRSLVRLSARSSAMRCCWEKGASIGEAIILQNKRKRKRGRRVQFLEGFGEKAFINIFGRKKKKVILRGSLYACTVKKRRSTDSRLFFALNREEKEKKIAQQLEIKRAICSE